MKKEHILARQGSFRDSNNVMIHKNPSRGLTIVTGHREREMHIFPLKDINRRTPSIEYKLLKINESYSDFPDFALNCS